ncbi:hypothetical protein GCM10027091_45410 [Streptomyces daliensis]
MARPEMRVDHTVAEVGGLAEYLRRPRAAAGLTYAGLAGLALSSAAALKGGGRRLQALGLGGRARVRVCLRRRRGGGPRVVGQGRAGGREGRA